MNRPVLLQGNYLYVFGLLVLVTGLPLSLFLMSLSQFILAGAFFLEGNVIEKFKRFFQNKAAVLISGVWLMHVLGLLWTEDLKQGLNDVRIKLPILVLTVIIAGSPPLSRKQFNLVLKCFASAVILSSLISTAVLAGIIDRPMNDIRDIFIFKISHIRFGLFACLSVFILLTFFFQTRDPLHRILYGTGAAWLIAFLFLAELITGLAITIIIIIVLLIYNSWEGRSLAVRFALIAGALIIPAGLYAYIYAMYKDNFSPKLISIDLNSTTEQGNRYTFNLDNPEMENGYPAYVYMCDHELRRSWNRRSTISFDSTDLKNQPIKYTLIRFLASKGLRKDSAAMTTLSEEEIRSIEKGIPNVLYQNPSIRVRLMEVMWEFNQYAAGGDPTGHSIMQRLESWKAARGVIKNNLLTGVGTGDVPAAVHHQYAVMQSKLDETHYVRSHNQYLSIAVGFGIIGLLYFLFAILYPIANRQNRSNLYAAFLIAVLLSMITEDTLETQPGATFFAFFNALLLFGIGKKKEANT